MLQVQAGQAEHLPKPWQEKALSQMLSAVMAQAVTLGVLLSPTCVPQTKVQASLLPATQPRISTAACAAALANGALD